MNYSYFLRFFGVVYGVYYLKEASFNSEKYCRSHASASAAYIKKIIVACPTDRGDPGRLTIVANEGAGLGLFE
jgi:hypothetical protein